MGLPPNSLLGKAGKENPWKKSKKMAEKILNVHYMYWTKLKIISIQISS
jgi:hypothetical protein